MTHRYPTRYRTAHTTEARSESTEKRSEKEKRKEQKRAEKEQKRMAKEQKRAEKEAAETLVQMSSPETESKSKKEKRKVYAEDTYCDACWREGEVVSAPNCRDECCTMNVCAYGCTFTCFMCEDSWRGTWSDRNDWFWAGYNDESFPVCPTCMPMLSGMPVFRSAAGLFPWTGLWPGVWIGQC